MRAPEEELWAAVFENQLSRVEAIIKGPIFDVNWKNPDYFNGTALYAAVAADPLILRALLSHPNIEVNHINLLGGSAFLRACGDGRVESVAVLLADHRLDVNQASPDNTRTGLWKAARAGHLGVVKQIISSLGRTLDARKTGRWLGESYTPLAIASAEGWQEVVNLLKRYQEVPSQTRHEVQVELGVVDAVMSELFALVIFLCDGLLSLRTWQDVRPNISQRFNGNTSSHELMISEEDVKRSESQSCSTTTTINNEENDENLRASARMSMSMRMNLS